MKKTMILTTIILLVALIACAIAYYFTQNDVLFSVAVTVGTCFYHLAMRLAVGHGIDAIFHNKMNYNKWWFGERKFEAGLYKFMRVKKWKKRMPTYNSDYFDLKKHSVEEIIQATCQSEVVHEVIMVLSWVPVIFTIWFGALVAFLVTSFVAFCFDGIFVILQRYNRPRLKRLLRK